MATAENSSDRLAEEARRGQEAFDRFVKPKLRPEDDGKFVAIDILSGSYEIGKRKGDGEEKRGRGSFLLLAQRLEKKGTDRMSEQVTEAILRNKRGQAQ